MAAMSTNTALLTGTPAELDAAIAASGDEAFVVRAELASTDDLAVLRTLAWTHRDVLARRCAGVAVVSDDEAVLKGVLGMAGTVAFPLTALADGAAADGWLAGQQAAGSTTTAPGPTPSPTTSTPARSSGSGPCRA